METTLHRQLKLRYATAPEHTEVSVDGFRIDAISDSGELIEIQHASLGALRDKTRKLLDGTEHEVRIVKPILARKRLVTLNKRGGAIKRSRMSPKRGTLLDIFEDLVHFATVFPRNRLILEVVLIEAEEVRVDKKPSRHRRKNYRCLDQKLVDVQQAIELRTAADLLAQLPVKELPQTWDTAQLAAAMERPRWFAQKVAYCLRLTGAASIEGKRGNSQLYRLERVTKPRAA